MTTYNEYREAMNVATKFRDDCINRVVAFINTSPRLPGYNSHSPLSGIRASVHADPTKFYVVLPELIAPNVAGNVYVTLSSWSFNLDEFDILVPFSVVVGE